MKLISKLLFLGLFSLALTNCADQLEIEPAQSLDAGTALGTEANVKTTLVGTYAEAGENDSYGGRYQMMVDLLGANGNVTWGGTFFDPGDIFNKTIIITNAFVANFWNNQYAVANQANLILDNLDVVESSAEERDRVEGEARFLRALAYFDLNRMFSSGDLGVPLRTEGLVDYSVDLGIDRASTSEVYALVVSDLERASDVLPEDNGIFADRYSAQALLARVQLQIGNYEAARTAADNVIMNSGRTLTPNYADAFNNDANSSEDLFAIQVTSQDGDNDLIVHYASEANGGRRGDVRINDAYLDLFDGDTTDVRGNFFVEGEVADRRLTAKYTNQFGNIALIRLAEMYLIRAEANLRLNSEIGASPREDLNTIRDRAGAELLEDGDAIDLTFILNERLRELAFEGFFVHDYRRLGVAIDGFAADDNALVFPIPQSELDTNTGIMQNPGYN